MANKPFTNERLGLEGRFCLSIYYAILKYFQYNILNQIHLVYIHQNCVLQLFELHKYISTGLSINGTLLFSCAAATFLTPPRSSEISGKNWST